ncbi:MAG: ComF family protein [Ignavibacteriaceae bacterium]
MNEFIISLFDFFLPRFCPACKDKLLPDEVSVCSSCFSKIRPAGDERLTLEYKRKFEGRNIISGFTSLYVFEKDKELQHIIHSIKYTHRFHNGIFLGKALGIYLADLFKQWNIDIIIPVPLHSVKKAERGYNQSYYISKGLNKVIKMPVEDSLIKRIKYTQSQTTMNITERAENIKNAFKVNRKKVVEGKNILLIDDVITTGATTSECGRVLLEAGAKKVYAASIAIAD